MLDVVIIMKTDFKALSKLQTISGFGTSSCWWSPHCTGEKTQNEIADLLYGDDGLKLNIYRYNVGGGYDKNNCRVTNPWRVVDGFIKYDSEKETREYDFSADAAAVEMMRKCLARGNVDTVIFFANSPHYSFTSSGQASGSLLYHTCNLPLMNYRAFAVYLIDVAEHFIKQGIPVKYLSPINEPQWKWGGSFVWQDGCHYEPEEVLAVYHAFAEELEKRNSPIYLYGPESGEYGGLTGEYFNLLMNDELVKKYLKVFAVHSYHADNDINIRKQYKNDLVSKHPQIRFDMSEWCELPCKNDITTIESALIAARIIGWDFLFAGNESWTSWVAVNQLGKPDENDGKCFSDGFFAASDNFSEYHIAMRYYAMAHYSKYVTVGAVLLDTSEFCSEKLTVTAFLNPDGKRAAVIVNEGENTSFSDGAFCGAEIIRTTQNEKLKSEKSDSDTITIPEKSLTTIIF